MNPCERDQLIIDMLNAERPKPERVIAEELCAIGWHGVTRNVVACVKRRYRHLMLRPRRKVVRKPRRSGSTQSHGWSWSENSTMNRKIALDASGPIADAVLSEGRNLRRNKLPKEWR